MLRRAGALEVILPEVHRYLGSPEDPDPEARDRADAYWRLLEALDADVHAGGEVTTPVAIAVLFLRIIEREVPTSERPPAESPEIVRVAAEVLEPFAVRSRLSRRDTSRTIRIIAQQRRFTQPSTKSFSRKVFVLAEEFPEALHLFRLRCMAWGQGWDVYEAWRERERSIADLPPEERQSLRGSSSGSGSGNGRRPRRRGRRRRGRGSGGSSAA
jgi:hypothetical protein